MNNTKSNHSFCFNGEIVEIFEKEGEQFAVVKFNSGFMKISIRDAEETHLGDKVVIDADLDITKVSPAY